MVTRAIETRPAQDIPIDSIDVLRNGAGDFNAKDSLLPTFLEFALCRYGSAHESYERIAALIQWPQPRLLLAGMAKRKSCAAEYLIKNCGACRRTGNHNDTRFSSVALYMIDVDLKPVCSIEEAFLFAFKKERAEIDVYDKLLVMHGDFLLRQFIMTEQRRLAAHTGELEADFARLVADGGNS
jgi:hypothetical protein